MPVASSVEGSPLKQAGAERFDSPSEPQQSPEEIASLNLPESPIGGKAGLHPPWLCYQKVRVLDPTTDRGKQGLPLCL